MLPLALPVFAAMTIAPTMAWKRAQLGPALLRLWWVAVASLVVGLIAYLGVAGGLAAAAFGLAAWLVLGALAELVERIRLFRIPAADSLARLRGLRLQTFGTALGHAGMGITVAGIAGMSLSTQSVVLLHPGESAASAGYVWRLDSVTDRPGPNYAERVATVTITHDGRTVATVQPSRRTFPVQRMTTTDTAIVTNGLADIYTVLGEERDGAAVLRLHYNPLAPWIWLGALVMASGGGLSLLDRRTRVGAPARAKARPPGAAVA